MKRRHGQLRRVLARLPSGLRAGVRARVAGDAQRVARRLQRIAAGDPFPPGDPAQLGLDPDRLDGLARAVERWVAAGEVVGAELRVIAGPRGGRRTALHALAGRRDHERRRPVVTDTVCDVRSMGKPLVGTAALMAVERGALALDTPAAEHLPSFRDGDARAITVEQLLTHTAGFDHPGFARPLRRSADLRTAVDALGRRGPSAPPGSRYRYSDAGVAVLAALLAEVEGRPIEAVVHDRVLIPLGMRDTGPCPGPGDPRLGRTSTRHARRGGALVPVWRPGDPPDLGWVPGCGGWWSTPTDYARLLAAWIDDARPDGADAVGRARLLGTDTVARALRCTPASRGVDRIGDHGMLWRLYSAPSPADAPPAPSPRIRTVFGHDGSDGTWGMAAPATRPGTPDVLVLYFTQTRGGGTLLELMGLVRGLLERR